MLQLLCPAGMYSYNHRCRLSSLMWTQTAEPGITRLLVDPVKRLTCPLLRHWRNMSAFVCLFDWITREFVHWDVSFLCKNVLKSLFGTCVDMSNIRESRINPSLLCLHSCVSVAVSTLDLRDQGVMVNFWPKPYFGVLFGHFSRGRVFWFSQWLIGLSVYGNTIKRATGHRAVPKWVPAGLLMVLCYC